MIPGVSADQEALLINMSRPIVLAQPLAFDKGQYLGYINGHRGNVSSVNMFYFYQHFI